MKLYSVYIRRHGLDPDRDYNVIKEGFSWPAFLFGGLWAAWHRMWFWAPVLFVVPAAVGTIMQSLGADPMTQAVAGIGWSTLAGVLANDLRRRHLESAGFDEAGVATGRDTDDALYAFLSTTMPTAPEYRGARA